jgi:uncharacterized protein with NRDE domain
MGTWLGITRTGRFAALTNYRDPSVAVAGTKSRGELVRHFLCGREHPCTYLQGVHARGAHYPGFNLLAGDAGSLWYYSNVSRELLAIKPGVYGLSNHLLDTPWPKVQKCRAGFLACLSGKEVEPKQLFALLADESRAPDEYLPDTGVGLEWERILSAAFVRSPGYGTRSSTVLLMDRQDRVLFQERTFYPGERGWREVSFEFQLDPGN